MTARWRDAIFPALGLPRSVRARVALMRERARAGALVVTCGGCSMEPAIALGERIAIQVTTPCLGAVAAFVTRGGELELHRLVSRGPCGWWVHEGDNQAAPQLGLVHAAQIVGLAAVARRRPSLASRARAGARLAVAAARVLARGRH